MDFEWDQTKNYHNIAKHGIDFEDAKHIFEQPILVRRDDRRNYGEERFIATGAMKDVVVIMTFTLREQRMRIISARKGNKHERQIYQNQIASRQN
jgi:uncharacterized DUF497 family protein